MRMQESLGLLVAHLDGIIVVDRHAAQRQSIVGKGLLESRRHKIITGAALVQNRKVDLEPEEVEEEGDNNQAKGSGGKVCAKLLHSQSSPDVQQVPEVDGDGGTNGDKGEDSDVFGGDNAGQGNSGQEQPLPPLAPESVVPELVEADVAQERQRHGKDQGCVQEDQSCLADMRVVFASVSSNPSRGVPHIFTEKNKRGGSQGSRQAVSALLHGKEHHGHSQSSKHGGHSSESHIRDAVGDVRVADVVKLEVAIVAHEPAHQSKQKLAKWRVDIEKVRPF